MTTSLAHCLLLGVVLASACTESDADVVEGAQVVAFDTATVHLSGGRDSRRPWG